MKPLLKFIALLLVCPLLFLGIVLGLFWHSFQAGVVYAEGLLIDITTKA
jgi:hypothetical protein